VKNSIGDARDGCNASTQSLSLVDRRGDIRRRVQSVMCDLVIFQRILLASPIGSGQPSSHTIASAPLLVLFALRRISLVILLYVSVLLWILGRQLYDLRYGCLLVPLSQKYDVPGVFLVFFGMISIAVFLVWAAIRLVALMLRVLKLDSSEP
jgi:hypothetical protein